MNASRRKITDRQLLECILERVDFPHPSGVGRVKAPSAKFTTTQVRAIRKLWDLKECRTLLHEALGVDRSCVWRIAHKRVYADVKD